MGGGQVQVRAPADDDHAPRSRPLAWPTCRWQVTARAGSGRVGPYSGAGAGRGPDPARKADSLGGAGAKQAEAAEGLSNCAKDGSGCVRLEHEEGPTPRSVT
jgi:hypothetical protein